MAQKTGTNWHSGRQEDASEFLLALLSILERELKDFPSYRRVLDRLYGRELDKKKFLDNPSGSCVRCGTFPSSSHQPFLTLMLTVPNCKSVELQKLLQSYFNDQDDALRMKCSNCCRCTPVCKQEKFCSRPAITHRTLTHAPVFLLIQLKRFTNGPTGPKVNTLVSAASDLKLLGCTDYKLLGTLDHQGSTIKSGHWVTNLMTEGGQRILCSDDHISQTDSVISSDNYILLYKKKDKTLQYPQFIPTSEWQELQPWQSVPPGCHVRMALDGSGKRMARLDIIQGRGSRNENISRSSRNQSVSSGSRNQGVSSGSRNQSVSSGSRQQSVSNQEQGDGLVIGEKTAGKVKTSQNSFPVNTDDRILVPEPVSEENTVAGPMEEEITVAQTMKEDTNVVSASLLDFKCRGCGDSERLRSGC